MIAFQVLAEISWPHYQAFTFQYYCILTFTHHIFCLFKFCLFLAEGIAFTCKQLHFLITL